eukprot:5836316-Prymnesium_polylepis.1
MSRRVRFSATSGVMQPPEPVRSNGARLASDRSGEAFEPPSQPQVGAVTEPFSAVVAEEHMAPGAHTLGRGSQVGRAMEAVLH